MPFSNIEQITPIMQEVIRIRPERMLDVGCGMGIYGILSRIQLDLYFDEEFYKKIFRQYRAKEKWLGVTIDALEGFSDYFDYIPKWVYNDIRIEDVRTALPKIGDDSYDLCLALAIIEHLDKEEGLAFIRHLRRISRVVIMSVPKQVGPQEIPGNPYETHRSNWSSDEFVALGASRFLPHSAAWIPVFDRADPTYAGNTCVRRTQDTSFETERLEQKLDALIRGQSRILDALSIKKRVRSLLKRI